MVRKPRLFIGSSAESLKMAEALKDRLSVCADATVWTKGVFSLSKTNIESICDALSEFDFAVLVFAPGEERDTSPISSRKHVKVSARWRIRGSHPISECC